MVKKNTGCGCNWDSGTSVFLQRLLSPLCCTVDYIYFIFSAKLCLFFLSFISFFCFFKYFILLRHYVCSRRQKIDDGKLNFTTTILQSVCSRSAHMHRMTLSAKKQKCRKLLMDFIKCHTLVSV